MRHGRAMAVLAVVATSGVLWLAPGPAWTQGFGSRSLEEHYLRVDWQPDRRGAALPPSGAKCTTSTAS
jgi:hypothetical protein